MMKAIAIAFSTYSKIPMPHFKWDPKALQYSMCAFPLVGAVIGAGEFAIWYLSVSYTHLTLPTTSRV